MQAKRSRRASPHQTTHRFGDGEVSRAVLEMTHEIRQRLRKMTPDQRGNLRRRCLGMQETHFYSFLRGKERALSFALLDSICDAMQLRFTVIARD